jgi:hypothetical protein
MMEGWDTRAQEKILSNHESTKEEGDYVTP